MSASWGDRPTPPDQPWYDPSRYGARPPWLPVALTLAAGVAVILRIA